jgi:hypothetical protein
MTLPKPSFQENEAAATAEHNRKHNRAAGVTLGAVSQIHCLPPTVSLLLPTQTVSGAYAKLRLPLFFHKEMNAQREQPGAVNSPSTE